MNIIPEPEPISRELIAQAWRDYYATLSTIPTLAEAFAAGWEAMATNQ